ncbi:hypothetical protein ACA910_015154 [Epithemia clementina (nom. ined.)]
MSAMKPFQAAAEKQAKSIFEGAASQIATWQGDFSKYFPHANLSQAAESLEKDGGASLSSALGATVNLIDKVSTDMTLVEQYITLTVPQMEDGNNFGVTIQLAAIKQITDAQEKLDKALDELMKYSAARADALEKCKLPSTSITETNTVSESNSQENAEEAKTTKSSSKETKSTTTKTDPSPTKEQVLRQQALVAVDLLFYSKAKTAYSRAMTAYLATLDFYHKNEQKITKPKGSHDGSPTGYSSMY